MRIRHDFEDLKEIYGGFPMKPDYMEQGNRAIGKYGFKAHQEYEVIRFPYLTRPLYAEEDIAFFDRKLAAEIRSWRLEADAKIWLAKDLRDGFLETGVDCWPVDGKGRGLYIQEFRLTDFEMDLAVEIVETFLKAAVDQGEPVRGWF